MGFLSNVFKMPMDLLGLNQGKYAQEAAQAQTSANQAGIDATTAQYQQMRADMAPWSQLGLQAVQGLSPFQQAGQSQLAGIGQMANAGPQAFMQQQALMGMLGPQAQQDQINAISNSPMMAEMIRQGESAMLQNASATGGLRGGNLQGALAQFRPEILNQLIDQQYSRLGGIAGMGGNLAQFLASSGQNVAQNIAGLGQASAAGTGAAGMNSASNIANLLSESGAAQGAAKSVTGMGFLQGVLGRAIGTAGNALGAKYAMGG